MTSVQQDFSGGINAFRDETKLADNEYLYGKNLRSRTGALEGIKKPKEYLFNPTTVRQLDLTTLNVNFTSWNCSVVRIFTFRGKVLAIVVFVRNDDKQAKFALFRLNDTIIPAYTWTLLPRSSTIPELALCNVLAGSQTITPYTQEAYRLDEVPEVFCRSGQVEKGAHVQIFQSARY